MERCGQLGQWCKPAVKEVVPEGCWDVAQPRGGRWEAATAHVTAVSKGRRQPHRLCERERWGPLIGTCRQWVFAIGDGDCIYTKHPPLSPTDVIRRDVRDVATAVCARESVKTEESNPSKQPCRLVLPMYIVERFPFLSI